MKRLKQDISILLVIESSKERNTFSSRLRMQGYKVEAPTGGFHAIHLLEKNRYSLMIILDDMEDMPGHEILSLARNVRAKSVLPILFISQNTDQEKLMEIIELGANEYQVYSENFNTTLNSIEKICPTD